MARGKAKNKEEYTMIQVHYQGDIDRVNVCHLQLSNRAQHVLARAKITHIGQILKIFRTLEALDGMGVGTAKEIRAAVFAFICANRKTTKPKLMISLEGC